MMLSRPQISTRPFYSSEHELYRRPEHDMSMALPHASPASDHYEAIGQMSRQDSPPVDGQSKSQAARKRVPVAVCSAQRRSYDSAENLVLQCDRCRKRKIKCSGSEGQGSACTNCLNAGYPNCQFLRVGSSALLFALSDISRSLLLPSLINHILESGTEVIASAPTQFHRQVASNSFPSRKPTRTVHSTMASSSTLSRLQRRACRGLAAPMVQLILPDTKTHSLLNSLPNLLHTCFPVLILWQLLMPVTFNHNLVAVIIALYGLNLSVAFHHPIHSSLTLCIL